MVWIGGNSFKDFLTLDWNNSLISSIANHTIGFTSLFYNISIVLQFIHMQIDNNDIHPKHC